MIVAAAAPAPASGTDLVLRLSGVDKRFGKPPHVVQALHGVDLEVRRGRVTGLIGPDGAGKTTLMRIASGLLTPERGAVQALGFDAARQSLQVQSRVGYMPQRFGLYEDLSVQENLDLYADLQGVAPTARAPRYRELMHMTGLASFTRRLAGRLSGGMKQKLGLACTLVHPPELLLLDEPTVGVDPVSRRELWQIVYRLVREQSMTVLLSTAYLDEAERCAEVILLHEGRVLGHGAPGDFSQPLTGRSFRVTAPDIGKRALQARLGTKPGVVDAVIQGEHVRVVLDAGTAQHPNALPRDLPGATIKPVPPRFEDAFVTMIRGDRPGRPVEVPAMTGAANTDGTVIQVRHLDRRFGDFYAVRDLSFDVRRGEVFGLLGANGAGKSTTFRMLCGLLPASGGRLSVAGVDLRTASATARARIGYMSQKFSLYGNLSVHQNLRFFASAYGLTGRSHRQRIDAALTGFELEGYRDTESQTLPLGYKQRLALACALLHQPDILFLDEPTSGVDPLARREFWARIGALAEGGVTVLVTTHFMEEAEYCDRMAIMAAGRILALGTPEQIKARARGAAKPEPGEETTMEDAFIALIEAAKRQETQTDAA
ncbi:MAG: ABC transporter ATP-binding protein [Gammaproteobacteria bacterium]|nr:ABC transporter ATP-binding protein [Gammaproteobacteria bacterium]